MLDVQRKTLTRRDTRLSRSSAVFIQHLAPAPALWLPGAKVALILIRTLDDDGHAP